MLDIVVHTDKHVRLSFEGRKVQSKVIFDAAFAVVVSLIGILVSSFLLLIWFYISNYAVLSSTYNHNTDTTGRPILKITHISGNVFVR